MFFHFCFFNSVPHVQFFFCFFGGGFWRTPCSKNHVVFLVPTLICFVFFVFRGMECFGFKRCSGTCVSPIFGLNLRIPNPALWKGCVYFHEARPWVFFSLLAIAHIFILKTCSINWTRIFATACKKIVNIKLFCVYHALLDFSWNVNRACRNGAPSHFCSKTCTRRSTKLSSSSTLGHSMCFPCHIQQAKHTLWPASPLKFAMYTATHLGKDCDVPRATSSSKLVFVVAMGWYPL